ncbi:glycine cleavage system protein GcvH [Amycolatopsis sp. NPDC005232]|uniref:glycine cleavage system protein GcvH n=1 Tax=Amycolatopsis sp. NPDC005232 TaxID=3157027 RepID=UPI0033A5C5DA
MAAVEEDLKYTAEHQWVRSAPGGSAQVGITDFAQESLGDLINITLPAVGDNLVAGESFGEIESTKSVSEVYAPVSGVVTAVNAAVLENPEIVNDDPYHEGWLISLSVVADSAEADSDEVELMDAEQYRRLIEA